MYSNSFDYPSHRSIDVQKKLQKFKKVLENNRNLPYKIGSFNLLSTGREVEKIEHIGNSVVCTTYFTSGADPQRNVQIENDNINYIESWYYSVLKLNLNGIVFHDTLSSEFIKKYQTPNIRFVKCKLGNFSLNDERFIIYYLFFLQYKPSYILLTDGNDVTITSDPFPFFLQKSKNTIFVGRGSENKIYQSTWNIDSVDKLSKNLGETIPGNFYDLAVYNAGVVGGSFATVMYFLRQISCIFFRIGKADNNNMAAMHYVLFYYFFPNCRRGIKSRISLITGRQKIKMRHLAMRIKLGFLFNAQISYNNDKAAISDYIFSGFPLNSKLKKFEIDSAAYIIHK